MGRCVLFMKFAVDKIEENIVVLECVETGEIIEAEKDTLPEEVHEGSILTHDVDGFVLDNEAEKDKKEELMARLKRLKNLKKQG